MKDKNAPFHRSGVIKIVVLFGSSDFTIHPSPADNQRFMVNCTKQRFSVEKEKDSYNCFLPVDFLILDENP